MKTKTGFATTEPNEFWFSQIESAAEDYPMLHFHTNLAINFEKITRKLTKIRESNNWTWINSNKMIHDLLKYAETLREKVGSALALRLTRLGRNTIPTVSPDSRDIFRKSISKFYLCYKHFYKFWTCVWSDLCSEPNIKKYLHHNIIVIIFMRK